MGHLSTMSLYDKVEHYTRGIRTGTDLLTHVGHRHTNMYSRHANNIFWTETHLKFLVKKKRGGGGGHKSANWVISS